MPDVPSKLLPAVLFYSARIPSAMRVLLEVSATGFSVYSLFTCQRLTSKLASRFRSRALPAIARAQAAVQVLSEQSATTPRAVWDRNLEYCGGVQFLTSFHKKLSSAVNLVRRHQKWNISFTAACLLSNLFWPRQQHVYKISLLATTCCWLYRSNLEHIQRLIGSLCSEIHSERSLTEYAFCLSLALTDCGMAARTTTLAMLNSGSSVQVVSSTDTSEEDQEDKCAICTSSYDVDPVVRKITACGHMFHRACVDQWFQKSQSCPLCRRRLGLGSSLSA